MISNDTPIKKTLNQHTIAAIGRYTIILILPFIMFHWMAPFVSDWTLGNDYPRFSIHHQLELQFALKTGTFPLFIPGFAGGQSASALTLGQVFHPISHIASLMPGYWNGKALEWNTLLRLLSLGIVHLVLFNFLKKLKISLVVAFILSFVTVYNLRMLDLFRYGASLEAWTGHILLCATVGWYYLEPTKFQGPLAIIGSTYLLVCSGHPQMMYWGFFGSILFILVIPYFCGLMLSGQPAEFRYALRYWLRVFTFCGIGIALSSAYVMPFYFDFITNNISRVGRQYNWALDYQDTVMGTINNFFQPLRSGVEGVFGGTSLILVAALLPVLKICRVKIPITIWIIWGILVAIFFHMQGARTPVHILLWKYLPLADSFRIAGRISLMMPIFIMLVLSWIMQDSVRISSRARIAIKTPSMILCSGALLIIIIYSLIPNTIVSQTSTYTATTIRNVPLWVEPISLVLGAATLIMIPMQDFMTRFKKILGLLLCLFICFQIMILLQHGTWIEPRKDTPKLARMQTDKKERLDYRLDTGSGMETSTIYRHLKYTFLEPFLGKVYPRYRIANDSQTAYTLMQKQRLPDEAIIEQFTAPKDPAPQGGRFANHGFSSVELVYSSYNRLIFDVRTFHHSIFTLAYPYTRNWKAFVNGVEVDLYRVNGAYHAVALPIGTSQIEFRYQSSAAFWGMLISCIIFALIVCAVCLRRIAYPWSIWGGIAVLIVVAAGFLFWHRSLYNGHDLMTDYHWNENSYHPYTNLAYGKRTNMSPAIYQTYFEIKSSSSRAVDGVKIPASGFTTGLKKKPWWIIDLHQPKSFSEIVIYEGPKASNINQRPLTIAISNEGKNWQVVGTVTEINQENPLRIKFNESIETQYLMIRASGTGFLSFDEVEIFPTQND